MRKEYDERIERIEIWINKSETIVDQKTSCNTPELKENVEILEVAMRNFETVKIDLQVTLHY